MSICRCCYHTSLRASLYTEGGKRRGKEERGGEGERGDKEELEQLRALVFDLSQRVRVLESKTKGRSQAIKAAMHVFPSCSQSMVAWTDTFPRQTGIQGLLESADPHRYVLALLAEHIRATDKNELPLVGVRGGAYCMYVWTGIIWREAKDADLSLLIDVCESRMCEAIQEWGASQDWTNSTFQSTNTALIMKANVAFNVKQKKEALKYLWQMVCLINGLDV